MRYEFVDDVVAASDMPHRLNLAVAQSEVTRIQLELGAQLFKIFDQQGLPDFHTQIQHQDAAAVYVLRTYGDWLRNNVSVRGELWDIHINCAFYQSMLMFAHKDHAMTFKLAFGGM